MATVNFFQPGSDADLENQQIQRKRDMALMLLQQSQKTPQGQMVSGHYVAPSILEGINNIAKGYVSRRTNDAADAQQRAMGEALRGRTAKETADFMSAFSGTPGTAATPAAQGNNPSAFMPAQEGQPAVAPDPKRAMAIALASQNPMLQKAGGDMMSNQMLTQQITAALGAGQGGGQSGSAATGGQGGASLGAGSGVDPRAIALSMIPGASGLATMVNDSSKPINVTEGGTIFSPRTGGSIFTAPKTEAGIGVSGGVATPVPGFIAAQAAREKAVADAKQQAESDNTLVTVNLPGGPRQMTRAQARDLANGGATPAPRSPMAARPEDADRALIFNGEMAKAKAALENATTSTDRVRAQGDIDGLTREMRAAKLPIDGAPGIPLQSQAEQARQQKTAEADVGRDTATQADVKTANKFLNTSARVKDVFEQGPTDSLVGSVLDAGAGALGYATKGSIAAQRLKALGGWMVSNVPRMEGPQSNFDVANYQVMAADVANDKLPLARRRAALESIEGMMRDVASGKAAAQQKPSSPGSGFTIIGVEGK